MRESEKIWQLFMSRPGAIVGDVVGIASENAINGLIETIRRYEPRRILEIGSGIGTLTYTVLKTICSLGLPRSDDFKFYTVENHPYCLAQLEENLNDYRGVFQVVNSTGNITRTNVGFDLIIVDGGGDLNNDMGVMPFSNMLASGGVIFVEGARLFQRKLVSEWYGSRDYIYVKINTDKMVSTYNGEAVKNKPYHLFVFEPSSPERLRLMTKAAYRRYLYKYRRRFG